MSASTTTEDRGGKHKTIQTAKVLQKVVCSSPVLTPQEILGTGRKKLNEQKRVANFLANGHPDQGLNVIPKPDDDADGPPANHSGALGGAFRSSPSNSSGQPGSGPHPPKVTDGRAVLRQMFGHQRHYKLDDDGPSSAQGSRGYRPSITLANVHHAPVPPETASGAVTERESSVTSSTGPPGAALLSQSSSDPSEPSGASGTGPAGQRQAMSEERIRAAMRRASASGASGSGPSAAGGGSLTGLQVPSPPHAAGGGVRNGLLATAVAASAASAAAEGSGGGEVEGAPAAVGPSLEAIFGGRSGSPYSSPGLGRMQRRPSNSGASPPLLPQGGGDGGSPQLAGGAARAGRAPLPYVARSYPQDAAQAAAAMLGSAAATRAGSARGSGGSIGGGAGLAPGSLASGTTPGISTLSLMNGEMQIQLPNIHHGGAGSNNGSAPASPGVHVSNGSFTATPNGGIAGMAGGGSGAGTGSSNGSTPRTRRQSLVLPPGATPPMKSRTSNSGSFSSPLPMLPPRGPSFSGAASDLAGVAATGGLISAASAASSRFSRVNGGGAASPLRPSAPQVEVSHASASAAGSSPQAAPSQHATHGGGYSGHSGAAGAPPGGGSFVAGAKARRNSISGPYTGLGGGRVASCAAADGGMWSQMPDWGASPSILSTQDRPLSYLENMKGTGLDSAINLLRHMRTGGPPQAAKQQQPAAPPDKRPGGVASVTPLSLLPVALPPVENWSTAGRPDVDALDPLKGGRLVDAPMLLVPRPPAEAELQHKMAAHKNIMKQLVKQEGAPMSAEEMEALQLLSRLERSTQRARNLGDMASRNEEDTAEG